MISNVGFLHLESYCPLMTLNDLQMTMSSTNQMFALLLDELALPAPVQKQMMSQQTLDQKWNFIKLNRLKLESRMAESLMFINLKQEVVIC